jgi:DNA repair protein RecO (recombination protein O)
MRVEGEPAWLLHHRPFREASRILEVLSRDHGRLSLVARGTRSGRSRLKGLLRPFQPLLLSWVARSELGTLTGAEVRGPAPALRGEGLMGAWYVNELVMHFVHRHDPQPELFAAYSRTIAELARESQGSQGAGVAARLRAFELDLLTLAGFAVDLELDAESGRPLDPARTYEYRVEHGPVPASADAGPLVFSRAELAGIQRRDFADPAVLRAAGRLLRAVIAFHLGGKELRSRRVLMDMRRDMGRDMRQHMRQTTRPAAEPGPAGPEPAGEGP